MPAASSLYQSALPYPGPLIDEAQRLRTSGLRNVLAMWRGQRLTGRIDLMRRSIRDYCTFHLPAWQGRDALRP